MGPESGCKSAAVSTATTPLAASASVVSTDLMTPRAKSLRTNVAWTMPATAMSSM